MEIFTAILLVIAGLILIVKGGDWFVDAASWIAEASGIPKFIIGATIVSVATTLPEQIVSFLAAAKGQTEMAIGNAVGSVTANVGLIMAISLLFMPAVVKRSKFAFKSILMMLSCVLLYVFTLDMKLGIPGSVAMLAIFVVFITENVISAKNSRIEHKEEERQVDKKKILPNVLLFIAGAAGIVIGARLLVDNAAILARAAHIPEGIISVTLVAIGTSLPELVTTVTAIIKKQSSMSIGNIIGANIIDLTVILPVCSFISGGSLPVSMQSKAFDFPACLVVIGIAMIPALATQKFRRWQGAAMIAVYAAYIVAICI